MKINNATAPTVVKPFVSDGKLTLNVVTKDNRVTAFRAVMGAKSKDFPVKGRFKVLEAWKQVEAWAKTLK